jgi:hypothetical protein
MVQLGEAEIRAFQAVHRNHLGKPLGVDGILGPETQWALEFQTLPEERRKSIETAQRHLDVIEEPPGSNEDPGGFIKGWLAACGERPKQSYCAAFASECLTAGGVIIRIAGAQALGKSLEPTNTPVAGDLLWFPTQGWKGHAELVIGRGPNEVMTIGGNVRDGVRCVRRPRAGARFGRAPYPIGAHTVCPGVIDTVPLVAIAASGTR